MSSFRAALAAVLLLAATACGNAAAAPLTAPAAPAGAAAAEVAPAASVQLVERLEARTAAAVPDVGGLSVARAKARMTGLQVQVISFRRGARRVSAQWPPAGDPRPAEGIVTVWLGRPPVPPARRPRTAAAGVTTTTAGADQAPITVTVGDAAAIQRSPGGDPESAAPAPATGVTPGLEGMVPPPHGPRANIRTLPPAATGTTLAGRASWYGPGFAGRGTACGTTFDPSELTLASRELRCGTKVRVTGPGGSVDATVTDWGPAEWTGRRFDLSQATFGAVASLGSGVIDVTLEVQ